MLRPLLPASADRAYHGHRLALWLFAVAVLMAAAMSLVSIFNGYTAASSADGIPLDTYGPAAARTVVTLFALLGLSHLTLCLLCLLVLARYRSLIPLLFALLLLEHLGRKLVVALLPIARTGTPPGSIVNLALLSVMVAGLALSLWSRDERTART